MKYVAVMYIKGPLLKKYFLKPAKVFEIHSGQESPLKIYLTLQDIFNNDVSQI